jgi:hypothetical protein
MSVALAAAFYAGLAIVHNEFSVCVRSILFDIYFACDGKIFRFLTYIHI